MKYINKFVCILWVALAFACNKAFLEEKPLDFKSTSGSFSTTNDFNASVYNLYNLVRFEFYDGEFNPYDYQYGLDIVFDGVPGSAPRFSDYAVTTNPNQTYLTPHWTNFYKIISEANVILSRLPLSAVGEKDRPLFEAKAKFFRAFAYRSLAYLYGGVPLVLQETTEARTDYVRAGRKEVYKQVIEDLTFAASILPGITAVKDGEVSNLAAQHLLAEVYLADGQSGKAIEAANAVINSADVSLMKERFGSQSADPGDVYWDMFRPKNQNRAAGNKEGIWVIQYEVDMPGGSLSSNSRNASYSAERQFAPLTRDFELPNKVRPFLWPVSDYTGGRGVAYAIPMDYFVNKIWESDFDNDIRNSNYNFVRIFTYNDPSKPEYYGKTISTQNPPPGVTVMTRLFFAYQSKVTTPGKHPDALFANKAKLILNSNAGGTYTDQYMIRLAETYLLRAEAYLGEGNLPAAAADINEVRSRSNAKPITASKVTLDYILDERLREFGVEEKRRLTLGRLGVIYNRTVNIAKNPLVNNIKPGTHELWPIPQSEIERNKDAKLEQNPGYY